MKMKKILYAAFGGIPLAIALAVALLAPNAKPAEHYVALAGAPARATVDCSSCHRPGMPYVGQDKVRAALDSIPASAPQPAIVCGTGTCGNVRNIGMDWRQTLIVGGQYVRGGQTSRQVGVYDANSIQTIGTYTGLDIWKLVNGKWQGQGCYFVGDSPLPLGNADYAARSKQTCSL